MIRNSKRTKKSFRKFCKSIICNDLEEAVKNHTIKVLYQKKLPDFIIPVCVSLINIKTMKAEEIILKEFLIKFKMTAVMKIYTAISKISTSWVKSIGCFEFIFDSIISFLGLLFDYGKSKHRKIEATRRILFCKKHGKFLWFYL